MAITITETSLPGIPKCQVCPRSRRPWFRRFLFLAAAPGRDAGTLIRNVVGNGLRAVPKGPRPVRNDTNEAKNRIYL
uniref:Uncharacterized protein n=1 Tax=Candidatus Kentrum sp. FW TaxID=2126338 RepID=A0A450T5W5_9GAMM|nr:MAG: hypothetical protein BECKFW1821A_GA0114235_112111 [Candidatus Kentron sp. FW]